MAIGRGIAEAGRSAWRGCARYAENPDPLASAGNRIALIVASNQPFYPLFVEWAAGDGGTATLLTWLSTPLFLAIPALARSKPRLGRAMLPLAGIGNTLIALTVLGPDSGVALFLAPCLVIAGLAFRPSERRWALGTTAIGILACIAAWNWNFEPAVQLETASSRALLDIHLISAGSLLILIGFAFADALASNQRSLKPPAPSDTD